jgi:predicted DNA-binding transcriptional regulator YafY
MRDLRRDGLSAAAIGQRYGVSARQVQRDLRALLGRDGCQ